MGTDEFLTTEGVPPGYKIDLRAHYSREHLWVRLEDKKAICGVA